jgi:hypothetical protein
MQHVLRHRRLCYIKCHVRSVRTQCVHVVSGMIQKRSQELDLRASFELQARSRQSLDRPDLPRREQKEAQEQDATQSSCIGHSAKETCVVELMENVSTYTAFRHRIVLDAS